MQFLNMFIQVSTRGTLFCDLTLLLMLSPNALGVITEVVKYLTKYLVKTTAYDSRDLKVSFELISINKLDELEKNS